jgi:hypothetical protein
MRGVTINVPLFSPRQSGREAQPVRLAIARPTLQNADTALMIMHDFAELAQQALHLSAPVGGPRHDGECGD